MPNIRGLNRYQRPMYYREVGRNPYRIWRLKDDTGGGGGGAIGRSATPGSFFDYDRRGSFLPMTRSYYPRYLPLINWRI